MPLQLTQRLTASRRLLHACSEYAVASMAEQDETQYKVFVGGISWSMTDDALLKGKAAKCIV